MQEERGCVHLYDEFLLVLTALCVAVNLCTSGPSCSTLALIGTDVVVGENVRDLLVWYSSDHSVAYHLLSVLFIVISSGGE
jgi:hypothetical protein